MCCRVLLKSIYFDIFLHLQLIYIANGEIFTRFCNTVIWSCEHEMMQWGTMSDQVADIITTWDTDDELSSDEKDAVLQLLPSNSPAASLATIGRESSDQNESDDESITSTQSATAGNIAGRNDMI